MIPPKYWSPTKKLMVLGAMAGGKLVEDTATGNPLVFITDKAKPLKSLLIPFTPQQSGTGDPSPENVRPIVPWNGLKVFYAGKNLAKMTYGKVPSASTGAMVDYNGWCSDAIKIDRTRNYFVSGITSIAYSYAFYYGEDDSYLGYVIHREDYSPNNDSYFSSATYVKIRIDVSESTTFAIQFEVGSTASEYEAPHITDTDISFPSPVYGGTLDVVSGVLTVEWIALLASALTWSLHSSGRNVFTGVISAGRNLADRVNVISDVYPTIPANISISSMDVGIKGNNNYSNTIYIRDTRYETAQDFNENVDAQIVYELEEPYEVQLTGEQITALVGNNTIWSDADGQMTAVYLKKG